MRAQIENDNILCNTGHPATSNLTFSPISRPERTNIFVYLYFNWSRFVFYTKTKSNNSVISNSFIIDHRKSRLDQSTK